MLTIDESVHQLTTTHEVTVGGKLGGTDTYERPALLVSLREACGASIGAAGGGATSKQTVPINAEATSLYLAISFEVKRDWARIVPARARLPFTSIEDRLWQWFTHYTSEIAGERATTPAEEAAAAKVLAGWVTAIEVLLDPPVTLLVQSPCPLCHQERARTDDSDSHALVVSYQRESLSDSVTLACRACNETIARGVAAVATAANLYGLRGMLPNTPQIAPTATQ